MNRLVSYLLVTAAIVAFSGLGSSPAADTAKGNVQWMSYDQARQEGSDRQKKYLLYFSSRNCGYCRMLENKTFANDDVSSYINTNYLPVRIDIDDNRKLAERYRVNGVPDLRFLSVKGEVISRWIGFTKADHMLQMLKFIQTDSYKDMNFKDFVAQSGES